MATHHGQRARKLSAVGGFAFILAAAAPSAFAVPTFNVDGIAVPDGSFPGGNIKITQSDDEVLLTGFIGESFFGLGKVGLIQDAAGNVTYTYGGSGSAFLTDVFDGFTVTGVVAPTTTTGGTISLTGGSLRYYVETTDPDIATGSQSTDLANASSGKLWLNLTPAPVDALGNTLILSIPALNSLSAFSGASAQALLNVDLGLPGNAGMNFATCSFAAPFDSAPSDCLPFFADMKFIGSADSNAAGDFGVSGSDVVKATAIPEPGSVALLSGGLLGLGLLFRRRRTS